MVLNSRSRHKSIFTLFFSRCWTLRILKNRCFVSTGAVFLRFRIFNLGRDNYQKSFKNEIQHGSKPIKNRVRKRVVFRPRFLIDFGSILAGFGVPNGGQDGPQIGKLGSDSNLFFRLFFRFSPPYIHPFFISCAGIRVGPGWWSGHTCGFIF